MERQSFMMTEMNPGTRGVGPARFTQGREDPFAQPAAVMPVTPTPSLGRAQCARGILHT